MKRIKLIATSSLLATLAALSVSWVRQTHAAPATTTAGDVQTRGSIRFIILPELQPDLPPGESRDLVLIACGTCHTTRYIMHQPPFPRDTWTAVVNKMRTTYSAPIKEQNVKPIVDYLVSVRGPQPN